MRRKSYLFIILVLLVVCSLLSNSYALNSESFKWEIRVSVEKTDIRMKPDINSMVVTTATEGSILISYEKVGEWFRVITADEAGFVVIGYIHSSTVEVISEKSIQEPDYWKDDPDFFEGIGLSVKLTGGLNYFLGGDIDEGTRGLCHLNADFISSLGFTVKKNIKPFHIGYDLTGDIIFNLSPKVGIGLGIGYIHATKRSFLVFSEQDIYIFYTLDSRPSISAVPIRLGLFLTLPLHRLFNITFNGGAALYLTKYSYTLRSFLWTPGGRIHHKASANGLGFHGGIGFEINLNPRSTFFIEIQGRYAKITNFKGTAKSREFISSYYFYPVSSSEEEGMLYYLEGEGHPSLAILEEEPSGYSTVRKATFDFSGFAIHSGIRIKF